MKSLVHIVCTTFDNINPFFVYSLKMHASAKNRKRREKKSEVGDTSED